MPLRRKNKRLLFVLVGVLVLVSSPLVLKTGIKKNLFQFKQTEVNDSQIGVVTRTDLVQNVTIAGTIVPYKKTIFTPPYNAYVKQIFVHLGQHVNEGDPIISLEESLRGTHEEVYPLRAPFQGTVVQILHEEGEYVETGKDSSPLIRVDDLTRLFVSATVPETDVDKMRIGHSVVIKATSVPDKTYRGIIREIFLAAVDRPQNYNRSGDRVEFQIKLEIMNADSLLRPGMTTILDVITDERHQVLALPHEYILKDKDDYFVTLENNTKKKIHVGLENDEMFEIKDGLKAGDRVHMVDFAAIRQEG
jgi:multidrug efflux pump subunit AcrA (membrane-fusion protein)